MITSVIVAFIYFRTDSLFKALKPPSFAVSFVLFRVFDLPLRFAGVALAFEAHYLSLCLELFTIKVRTLVICFKLLKFLTVSIFIEVTVTFIELLKAFTIIVL